jgi:hypothetical protein
MRFGWKPKETIIGAPIPLYYDYETFDVPVNPATKEEYFVNYMGPRISNTLEMHKAFANQKPDQTNFNNFIHGKDPIS